MRPHARCRLNVELLEPRDVPAAVDTLAVLPTSDQAVLDNARAIAELGRQLGRRADAFMKVGDSNTATGGYSAPQYLNPLGDAAYNVYTSGLAASHPELLDTLAAYRSAVDWTGANSFTRTSTSAYPGWTLANVLPTLAGEIAATNAGVALVMIGTNDLAVYGNAEQYRAMLEQLVQTLTAAGVVPVLSALPDHIDNATNAARVPAYNQVIADVGEKYRVPVWNLSRELKELPGEGLQSDGVHLNSSPNGGGGFGAADLLYGQNVRNLEALQILDWFREKVEAGPDAVAASATWTPLSGNVFAVGRDAGQGPTVGVYDASTGAQLDRITAYEPSFDGGVRVATGDVNGDGVPDVITAPGPGGGPVVKVFSGKDGALLDSILVFEASFRGGLTVAAADLDGDGRAEVVVGAGAGGGPAVAVLHGGDLREVQRFFAFEASFRGGVDVAAGTFAGYGPAVAVGAGSGGGPVVAIFDYGSNTAVVRLMAFESSYRGGVDVAVGDLNGDGAAEVAVAPGSGSTRVRVLDPRTGSGLADFFAGTADAVAGVRLAVVGGQLLAGSGSGSPTVVRAYWGLSTQPESLVDDPGRAYGVYVG